MALTILLKLKQVKSSHRRSGVKVVWEQINGMDIVYIADQEGGRHLLRSFIPSPFSKTQSIIQSHARKYYRALTEISYHEQDNFDSIVVFPDGSYQKLA